MDFALTEEHKMLQEMARDFANNELVPHAAEWDQKAEFPKEAIKKMAELGLMGIVIPTELGGAGMDNLAYVIALEEIAVGCASTAVTMSVNNSLYLDCIMKNGSDDLKKKYVPEFAQGQKLGAYALTEPQSGSDAAQMFTTAVKKGDKYILNGTKSFITNAPDADATIVYASTDRDKGHKGITAFIVDNDAPGFKTGKKEDKLGIRASSTSEVILEDCEVPANNVLGEEGKGFYIAMGGLDGGRIGIATQALGIGRAGFEAAAKYSGERIAFGKPIMEFEGIQWKIADMAMKIDASRLLIHRAAWMKDNNLKHTKEASMAKLFASEAANWIAKEAVQVFGGYGYVKEFPVERFFRDAKITEIYEGTSEIQRIVIARNALKEMLT
jgi:butyryl-CoA dehydrogenase